MAEEETKNDYRIEGIFPIPVYLTQRDSNLDLTEEKEIEDVIEEGMRKNKFNSISNAQNIDIFALGGIKESNINKLKLLKIKGFGAISLFKKKPAFKRPVFLKNNFF